MVASQHPAAHDQQLLLLKEVQHNDPLVLRICEYWWSIACSAICAGAFTRSIGLLARRIMHHGRLTPTSRAAERIN